MKKLIKHIKEWYRIKYLHKEIPLTNYEKKWILLCKGHFNDKYEINATNWIDSLKPMFEEIYGYSPEEKPEDFRRCICNKLLDIWVKVKEDYSGSNVWLKDLFSASFSRSFKRDYESPIDRVIAELCGQLQCTLIINKDGTKRFSLDLEE